MTLLSSLVIGLLGLSSNTAASHESLLRKGRRVLQEENYSLNYGSHTDKKGVDRFSRGSGRFLDTTDILLDGQWICFNFSKNNTDARPCLNDAFEMPLTWSGPAMLKITDMYNSGDRFEVTDVNNHMTLGLTSDVGSTCSAGYPNICNDDPDTCFSRPMMSTATYCFGEGDHNITIHAVQAPCLHSFKDGFGEAYFQLSYLESDGNCTSTAVFPVDNILAPGDDDLDGIENAIDKCSGTMSFDSAASKNDVVAGRWALNGGGIFVTGTKGDGKSPKAKKSKAQSGTDITLPQAPTPGGYTLQDTHGCSCSQIVSFCGYQDDTLLKKGCTETIMAAFAKEHPQCLSPDQLGR